jgi:hypothetical protein
VLPGCCCAVMAEYPTGTKGREWYMLTRVLEGGGWGDAGLVLLGMMHVSALVALWSSSPGIPCVLAAACAMHADRGADRRAVGTGLSWCAGRFPLPSGCCVLAVGQPGGVGGWARHMYGTGL